MPRLPWPAAHPASRGMLSASPSTVALTGEIRPAATRRDAVRGPIN